MAATVLDAQPLSTLFHEQPGWEYVDRLLESAIESGEFQLLSSINLGEVYYSILRDFGEIKAGSPRTD